jgi:Pyridoxamine 5'-phosphate oxidase
MAKVFDHITDSLQQFIAAQQMFFVASAPRSDAGHVNLSPKGLDSFRILSPTQVAYVDLTGSGNETAAHLQENGRITLMFCAFQGAPLILRLFGKGRVVLPQTDEWDAIAPQFSLLPGTRQIIVADLDRIQTSCGTGVPLYELQGQRTELLTWAEKKGEAELNVYRQRNNQISIDGLLSSF